MVSNQKDFIELYRNVGIVCSEASIMDLNSPELRNRHKQEKGTEIYRSKIAKMSSKCFSFSGTTSLQLESSTIQECRFLTSRVPSHKVHHPSDVKGDKIPQLSMRNPCDVTLLGKGHKR